MHSTAYLSYLKVVGNFGNLQKMNGSGDRYNLVNWFADGGGAFGKEFQLFMIVFDTVLLFATSDRCRMLRLIFSRQAVLPDLNSNLQNCNLETNILTW